MERCALFKFGASKIEGQRWPPRGFAPELIVAKPSNCLAHNAWLSKLLTIFEKCFVSLVVPVWHWARAGSMDPFTAIGLAGNIVAFIDFSYKVISGVSKIRSTLSGMTPENESLNVLVEDLNNVTQNLVTDIPARTENEKQLCTLAANCHALSVELHQILRRLKVGDKSSKWEGLMVKWHSMRKEKEIDSIERRLNGYQAQILIRLQVMFRFV